VCKKYFLVNEILNEDFDIIDGNLLLNGHKIIKNKDLMIDFSTKIKQQKNIFYLKIV
jgi:hypothetical protein